jgi:Zn-dependent oligopeptidase
MTLIDLSPITNAKGVRRIFNHEFEGTSYSCTYFSGEWDAITRHADLQDHFTNRDFNTKRGKESK